ncbi:putative metalloprotease CJM1_0395 family protein [Roseospira navarrensis]|uniref:SprA-related family protein n=1 Tax=Roseospira navarrensis TaxID=140058 RepID=A0A7X1ZBM3_9PROT|nr:putative metalloprotease CJM1_0395 family protein [Roseospira navarrensis]MQX35549.1 hypothetical protein [Roseospira navarrensis]
MQADVIIQAATPQVLTQRGPAAVEEPSARLNRQGPNSQQGSTRGAAAASGARGPTRPAFTIAGSAPSLSTEMIGVFGGLNGSQEATTGGVSRPIDPLTGELAEIDPLTGEPEFTDPASVEVGALPGAAGGMGSGGASGGRGEDAAGADGLTEAERAEVRRLQAIDRRVRQHEAAHRAAGAGVTGPASYTFVTGPDGKQYAVAGEVPIRVTASGGDPEQVIRDMEQVRRAALAPADPSPADRAAAAAAQAAATQAEADVRRQERAEEAEADAEREAAEAEAAARQRTDAADADSTGAFAAAAAAYGSADTLALLRPGSGQTRGDGFGAAMGAADDAAGPPDARVRAPLNMVA